MNVIFLIVKSEFVYLPLEIPGQSDVSSNFVTDDVFYFCFVYGDLKPLKSCFEIGS